MITILTALVIGLALVLLAWGVLQRTTPDTN
jgi:multisubunit Na+/H+ antiporter MnhC subunit